MSLIGSPDQRPLNIKSVPKIWYALPTIVLVLILISVGFVYLWSESKVREKSRTDIYSDLYWVEQLLNARVVRSQQEIQKNILQLKKSPHPQEDFRKIFQPVIGQFYEIMDCNLIDSNGKLLASLIENPLPIYSIDNGETPVLPEQIIQSNQLSGMYKTTKENVFEVYQPIYNDSGSVSGYVSTRYNVNSLFNFNIPKWFFTRYNVEVDYKNRPIFATGASKSENGEERPWQVRKQISYFDVPVLIKAEPVSASINTVIRILIITVMGLTSLLIVILAMLAYDTRIRRLNQQEMSSQYNLRRAMEDSLHIGLRAHAIDGRLIYVNHAFCEMIGYDSREILKMNKEARYIPPSEESKFIDFRKYRERPPSVDSREFISEVKMCRKDNVIIDTILRARPMFDNRSQHVGWISSVEDVTEQKRLEAFENNEKQRLEKVQQLITMGEMASTISHELNQPLSAISSYSVGLANFLEKNRSPDAETERIKSVIDKICRQAERAAKVTKRVQQFVKQNEILIVKISVKELLLQEHDFLELELRQKGGEIKLLNMREDWPLVIVDVTMIQQILTNLVRNALDAMVNVTPGNREISIGISNHSTTHLKLTIRDKGPGVPVEMLERIFEPFFTTKNHGVGIGLNICRTMIESNGGRLWSENDGEGGLFYLTLPIADLDASIDSNPV